MRPFIFGCVLTLALTALFGSAVERSTSEQALKCSVTVGGNGSGVLHTTSDGQVWVWTAAHVVEHLRGKAADGTIHFQEVTVSQFETGETSSDNRRRSAARVVKYSDYHNAVDLAVLQVADHGFTQKGASFYASDRELPLGVNVWHVGSPQGSRWANTLFSGTLGRHAWEFSGQTYDNYAMTVFPGCSGGGVFLKSDGRLLGLVVRQTPGAWVVPVQQMIAWANENNMPWAYRKDLNGPSDVELARLPVE